MLGSQSPGGQIPSSLAEKLVPGKWMGTWGRSCWPCFSHYIIWVGVATHSGPWLAHLYSGCVSPAGEVAPVWDQESPGMWGDPVSTLPPHCEQPCQIRSWRHIRWKKRQVQREYNKDILILQSTVLEVKTNLKYIARDIKCNKLNLYSGLLIFRMWFIFGDCQF